MRGFLLAIWILMPVLASAYHYGPGQTQLQLDDAQRTLNDARREAAAGRHAKAAELFAAALEQVPPEKTAEARPIRLERAKSLLLSRQLPAAYDELNLLVPELQEDPTAAPELLAAAREALANARYYVTWLMRLEGKPRPVWEPEIEAARQTYRLLAEQSQDKRDETETRKHQDDLEAAVRLARLDLSELQALPLPSQCQGCCSGDCNGKKQGKGKGKGKGKTPEKKQGDETARGASSGPPPDDGGN